ncbi:hypothetical protein HXX76_015342 [Chlamydomonas incerta]|uniref:Uncharacterized protein n=1 Tax=Chlamydomonas incerta TaxID=51695 RepID=A0A835SA18_CHLIN|nr:hypothetical protein HXX76_015342 [Chlamydomonas incerta]|eukprot:KAG2423472.1 hypothetical protein HXX76_015342 [Chlamydomonas incerta]
MVWPPCFDLRSKAQAGVDYEDEWGEFVSAVNAVNGELLGDSASMPEIPQHPASAGDTPRSASPTASRCSEAATSSSSNGRSDSRRFSSDSGSRACSGCRTPSSSEPGSTSSGGTCATGGNSSWARGLRAMMADINAKRRAWKDAEEARIAQEEAEATAARIHEDAVAALMRNDATRPQAEAVVRRRRGEAQRLGNGSLRRLPRQAQEIEGEKVQEGVCAAALRRELAVVAHQASLFGGFR